MRKPVTIALAIVMVALAGVIMWQLGCVWEPIYQGKALSVWLEEYDNHFLFLNSPSRDQAKSAIRQIGTNALPVLLEWAAARDSTLKKKAMVLAKRQSLFKIHFCSADEYHARSDAGFSALGPLAKPAVPALIDLLGRGEDEVRVAAAYDLMWIGPEAQEAVPVLVKCLSDTNRLVCFRATRCLGHIHMRPEIAVPALIQNLGQPSVPQRETIAALVAFGAQARPAVPNLLLLLNDNDPMARAAALMRSNKSTLNPPQKLE